MLHLTHSLVAGGKERVLLELAQRGRAAGHNDQVLLFDEGGAGELDPGDVPVTSLPRNRSVFGYALRLARHLRRVKPRVVHAHNHSAAAYAGLAAKLGGGVPLIVTFHNLPSFSSDRSRRLTRFAVKRARARVCVSADLAMRLQAAGWIEEAQIIPNGVDVERFPPGDPRERGPLRVGMLARFDHNKRQADLARALQGLDSPWELKLAGDGPDRVSFEREHQDSRISVQSHVEDVPSWLRELDVLALLSDHEGTPMSVLEGMSSGLPVIASDVGGLPAMLEGRGLLVPPRNVEAATRALVELTSLPRREELGRAARDWVVRSASAERMYTSYDSLYS